MRNNNINMINNNENMINNNRNTINNLTYKMIEGKLNQNYDIFQCAIGNKYEELYGRIKISEFQYDGRNGGHIVFSINGEELEADIKPDTYVGNSFNKDVMVIRNREKDVVLGLPYKEAITPEDIKYAISHIAAFGDGDIQYSTDNGRYNGENRHKIIVGFQELLITNRDREHYNRYREEKQRKNNNINMINDNEQIKINSDIISFRGNNISERIKIRNGYCNANEGHFTLSIGEKDLYAEIQLNQNINGCPRDVMIINNSIVLGLRRYDEGIITEKRGVTEKEIKDSLYAIVAYGRGNAKYIGDEDFNEESKNKIILGLQKLLIKKEDERLYDKAQNSKCNIRVL